MSSSLTPDQALKKVLKTSRLNGWSVALFAGFCTAIASLLGDSIGILVGAMVVASGIMEVHGNRLLRRRDSRGMRWLVRAQLFLIAVIHVYSISRILSFTGELAVENLSPIIRETIGELELNLSEFQTLLRNVVQIVYCAVMLSTWIYQGGLAFYYSRRRALVEQALSVPPKVVSDGATSKDLER